MFLRPVNGISYKRYSLQAAIPLVEDTAAGLLQQKNLSQQLLLGQVSILYLRCHPA